MLKTRRKWGILIAVFFLLQLCLQYGYPLTSDDLYFRHAVHFSGIGDMVNYVLHFGSGRFLGNLGTMLTVREEWLRILWKSAGMTVVYGSFLCLLKIRRMDVALLGAGLFLFPSVKMYAQVYVWTMGFQIYVMPIALFLITLIFREWIKKVCGMGKMLILFLLIPCFSAMSQLFVENCSLIFGFAALCLMVGDFLKKEKEKKVLAADLLLLLGSLVGAGAMFLGPSVLGGNTGGVEGYRHIPSTIGEIAESCYHNGAAAGRYLSACTGIWGLLAFAVLEKNKKRKGNPIEKTLRWVAAMLVGFSVVHIATLEEVIRGGTGRIYFFAFCLQIAFLVMLCWYCFKEKQKRTAVMIAGAMVSIFPLLLVSPISPRVFFLSWLFLLGAGLTLLEQGQPEGEEQNHLIAAAAVILGVSVALIIVSAEWRYGNDLRMLYVERMTKENPDLREIDLPELPNSRLLQADADDNYWNYVLKDYLGLEPDGPERIEITWYDWYNWLNVKEEE